MMTKYMGGHELYEEEGHTLIEPRRLKSKKKKKCNDNILYLYYNAIEYFLVPILFKHNHYSL